MKSLRRVSVCVLAMGLSAVWAPVASGWDEAGHIMVVDAARARLPDDLPGFLMTSTAQARLRFLGAEPDRWRNVRLAPMGMINSPDHYFDVELLSLYDLKPETLPPYRYDFLAHMAAYKALHPDKDYGYDPAHDPQHDHQWPGFAPYRVCEVYMQLKSSWRTLNTYEKYSELAAPGEIETCRENIIYLMGIMSHYVADLAQPLHTTVHYDGWTGPNPNGYVTDHGYIHKLMDGGVIELAGLTAADLPGKAAFPKIDDQRLFEQVMAYVVEANGHVEEVYSLDKRGAFKPSSPEFSEGVGLVRTQLDTAAAMLAALWESAYRDAGIDSYRENVFKTKQQSQQQAATPAETGS